MTGLSFMTVYRLLRNQFEFCHPTAARATMLAGRSGDTPLFPCSRLFSLSPPRAPSSDGLDIALCSSGSSDHRFPRLHPTFYTLPFRERSV